MTPSRSPFLLTAIIERSQEILEPLLSGVCFMSLIQRLYYRLDKLGLRQHKLLLNKEKA